MDKYTVKWIKVKPFSFTCPLAIGQGTNRVLVLLEGLPYNEDDYKTTLLSDAYGETVSKILDYAAEHAKVNFGKILFISTMKYKNTPVAQSQINKIIAKFKADCVLIMGVNTLPKLTNIYNPTVLNSMPGRIIPVQWGKLTVNTLFTFNINTVATSDPKWFKSTINLLGFVTRHLITAIENKNRYNIDSKPVNKHVLIKNEQQLKDLFKLMHDSPKVCIDTETENLNRVRKNRLLTIQVATDANTPFVIPVAHPETPFDTRQINKIRDLTLDYLMNGKPEYQIYHFAKFDLLQLAAFTGQNIFPFQLFDTAVGEYFLDENRKFFRLAGVKKGYALEALALQYGSLDYTKDTVGKEDRANLINLPLKQVARYGSKDVVIPFRMHEFQLKEAKFRGYDTYKNAVLKLGSDMISVFTEMESNGSLIDSNYLTKLMLRGSSFSELLEKKKNTFKNSKSAQSLNKELLKEAGLNIKKGLFGKIDPPWMLDLGKVNHLQRLFFDKLKLDIKTRRKDGGGTIDKAFIKEYKYVPEVSELSELRSLNVLKNTYIVGTYKSSKSDESEHDSRLRASYDFISILTVRTSSKAPNLQAIPSHGTNAEIIKREFIAEPGKLVSKADYSAHEVRGWANIAKDKKLIKVFSKGLLLRRRIRKMFLEDVKLYNIFQSWLKSSGWKELKTLEEMQALAKSDKVKSNNIRILLKLIIELEVDGDIHKLNYQSFFGVPAYKVTKSQRQSVKAVVFGVMYGKGAFSLALEVFENEFRELSKQNPMYSKEWFESGREYFEKAQELIDKLFSTFVQGGEWIKTIQEDSATNYHVKSAFGAERHLWGYMHHEEKVHKMMNRRGPNSMTQGASSNILYTAARNMQLIKLDLQRRNFNLEHMLTNIVHDSTENEFGLIRLPISTYYLEHCMTTLSHKTCKEVYGFEMPIQLEIELELGGSHANLTKWDFNRNSLQKIVSETIDWQQDNLGYKYKNKDEILNKILHNSKIIDKIRLKEIERQEDDISGSTYMWMTPKRCVEMDWAL